MRSSGQRYLLGPCVSSTTHPGLLLGLLGSFLPLLRALARLLPGAAACVATHSCGQVLDLVELFLFLFPCLADAADCFAAGGRSSGQFMILALNLGKRAPVSGLCKNLLSFLPSGSIARLSIHSRYGR